jgi:hypothetical protein
MKRGYPVTVYNTHGAALGGFFSAAEKNPIGKIEKLFREEDKIKYEMFISPTSEGRDVIQLIHDGVMNPTSVRIYDFQAKMETTGEDDESIMVLEDGYIGGIDFCDVPGVPEAGITQVLESALVFGQPKQEEDMDWNEVTLEGLKENRQDLLQSYVVETVQQMLAERDALKATIAELETKAQDTSKSDEQATEIAKLTEEVSLWQAAATPIVKEVAAQLRDIPAEERQAKADEVRAAAIAAVMAEASPRGEGVVQETKEDIGDEVVEQDNIPEDMMAAFGDQMRKLAQFTR